MYIYHEKQVSSLCGQHCINNLLQMPAFTAYDLADIAHELDARERQMMLAEGSTTPEALKFLAEDSGNVDEAGNFSLQVLSEALTRSQGLRLVSAGSEDVKGKLNTTGYDQEPGFVCNRHSHWLTIRNINGKYWNLNSMLEAPERITTFALEATLYQYTADGYSVFVVRSAAPSSSYSTAVTLPSPDSDGPDSGGDPKDWVLESHLLGGTASSSSSGKFATLGSAASSSNSSSGGSAQGAATAAAKPVNTWATAGSGQRLDGGTSSSSSSYSDRGTKRPSPASASSGAAAVAVLSEEDEIAQAIALSLADQDGPSQ
eukprot:19361-Heterococcus_DN1.PRE.1